MADDTQPEAAPANPGAAEGLSVETLDQLYERLEAQGSALPDPYNFHDDPGLRRYDWNAVTQQWRGPTRIRETTAGEARARGLLVPEATPDHERVFVPERDWLRATPPEFSREYRGVFIEGTYPPGEMVRRDEALVEDVYRHTAYQPIITARPDLHYDPNHRTITQTPTPNAQPPMSQTRYILEPDGSFIRETVAQVRLASSNQLAQRLAATAVVPFRDAGWPPDFYVGITSNRAVVYAASRVRSLQLNTFWAPGQDPGGELYLTPHWSAEARSGTAATTREWVIPEEMPLWMVFRVPPLAGQSLYMAMKTPAAGWRTPCVPNVYPDGRVCTGNDIGRWTPDIAAQGLHASWLWAKALLDQTPWCSDLSGDAQIALASKLIRFSAEPGNTTQLEPNHDSDMLWESMPSPNCDALNWLGEVVL